MGWLYYHREKGESNLDHFRDKFDEPERLIDGATVGGTFYGAYRRPKDDKITALIILTRWTRGDYNFGYKDMSEDMGPGEARCPARILDLLSPVEELFGEEDPDARFSSARWAREWRERCRANIAKAAAMPKVRKGDTVKVSRPFEFTDDVSEDTFTLIDGRRNHWKRASDGRLVRLRKRSSWPEHEVVAA